MTDREIIARLARGIRHAMLFWPTRNDKAGKLALCAHCLAPVMEIRTQHETHYFPPTHRPDCPFGLVEALGLASDEPLDTLDPILVRGCDLCKKIERRTEMTGCAKCGAGLYCRNCAVWDCKRCNPKYVCRPATWDVPTYHEGAKT